MSWKQWDQGEVVEAGDLQVYLQDQVIQVYPNSSERSTTLGTAVAEGMVSYLEDTDSLEVYDSTQWVSVGGAAGDITSVTAGTALTGGGTTGDVTLDVDLNALGKVDQTNGTVTTADEASTVVRNITLSTAVPTSGDGSDGDVWLVYTA